MEIGLRKGIVELYDHDILWEENAKETINLLKNIFQNIAVDIQHIGSTSIKNIKAKPIIDIIIGINDFTLVNSLIEILKQNQIVYCPIDGEDNYMLFIKRNIQNDMTTHHIHIVKYNGDDWINRTNFRDYLNTNIVEAKEYEKLKIELSNKYKNNRAEYTKNKLGYFYKIYKEAKEGENNNYKSNPNGA
ncbi:hypothetical protein AGMMS49928_15910 [Spirochaetia bacterium]|nr:hypothetical protein AGMMS49928_15910 [Spirochaetia bacterium]